MAEKQIPQKTLDSTLINITMAKWSTHGLMIPVFTQLLEQALHLSKLSLHLPFYISIYVHIRWGDWRIKYLDFWGLYSHKNARAIPIQLSDLAEVIARLLSSFCYFSSSLVLMSFLGMSKPDTVHTRNVFLSLSYHITRFCTDT